MIGVFRSLLFRLADDVPSRVRFVVERLLCFLIVGIHASGISIPLSLLMLLEWSLIWIASFTLLVYRWGSRSINLTWFHKGRCPVSFACSETAEVCVWASRISLSCSFLFLFFFCPTGPYLISETRAQRLMNHTKLWLVHLQIQRNFPTLAK